MCAELLADGQDITRFDAEMCVNARRYIARCLLTGLTQAIHTNIGTQAMSSPIRTARRRHRPPDGLDMGALMEVEGVTFEDNPQSVRIDTNASHGSDDNDLTLESINDPNGWLTDEVITRYFRYLTERNRQWDSNMVFLSPHFYNRLVDMSSTGPVIRSHIQSALSGEPSQEAYLELKKGKATHNYW